MGQDNPLGPAGFTWEGLSRLSSPLQRGTHRATSPFSLQGPSGYPPYWALGDF